MRERWRHGDRFRRLHYIATGMNEPGFSEDAKEQSKAESFPRDHQTSQCLHMMPT